MSKGKKQFQLSKSLTKSIKQVLGLANWLGSAVIVAFIFLAKCVWGIITWTINSLFYLILKIFKKDSKKRGAKSYKRGSSRSSGRLTDNLKNGSSLGLAKFLPARAARRKLLPGLVVILVFLVGFAVYKSQQATDARAGWFNDRWGYRKKVTITNGSGGELTDFQVEVTLDTASLITASKMQSDCDDLRITDVNGKVLPHWIEESNPGCNDAATKIWFKHPILSTAGASIYVYYGNSSVGNTEDGNEIFEFFDDFNDGVIDSTWTQVDGTWSESGGVISKTGGGGRLRASLSSGFDYIVETKLRPDSWGTDYRMGILSRLAESGSLYAHIFTTMYNDYGKVVDLNEVIAWGTPVSPGFTFATSTWYNFKTSYIGTDQMKGKAWQVGTSEPSWQKDITFSTSRTERNVGPYAAQSSTASWDNFRVRKYSATEPSAGSPAAEEVGPAPIAYWSFDEGYGAATYDSTQNNHHGNIVGEYSADMTGSGTASANSYYLSPDPTYHPDKAFDDNLSTYWDGCCSGYPDQWLKYDFGAQAAKIINQYKFEDMGGECPVDWTFEGSSDDSNWTVLDTQNFTSVCQVNFTSPPFSEGPNTTAYRYYRFHFTEGYGGNENGYRLEEVELIETDPYWRTEDVCISGKCLYFNGTSDYVSAGDPSSGLLDFGLNSFTMSAWFKPTGSSYEGIIGKHGYEGYEIFIDSNRNLKFSVDDVTDNIILASIDNNAWYHVSVVINSNNDMAYAYLNGELQTSTDISSRISVSSDRNLVIGARAADAGKSVPWDLYNPFQGFIDEVKIYPYARTAEEIKTDYIIGAASAGSSAVIGMKDQVFLSDGLVGYWKMDEDSWDGTPDEVIDSSGNGNNGQGIGATPPTTGAGKFGNGGVFDGNDDYVTTPSGTSIEQDNTAKNYTITLWFNADTAVGGARDNFPIGQDNGGYDFFIEHSRDNTGDLGIGIGEWKEIKPSGTIQTNTWYFITVVLNGDKVYYSLNGENLIDSGGNRANYDASYRTAMTIGSISPDTNNLFDGSIDNVRIYNRALSPREVQDLYNWAPGPFAYYDFNEGVGVTLNDRSGNGLDGVLNNSPVWSSGKYGKGLRFNGTTNQSVTVNDFGNYAPSQEITVGFWVKSDSLVGNQNAIWLGNDSPDRINVHFYWNPIMYWDFGTCCTPRIALNPNLTVGVWHYFAYTSSVLNNRMRLYMDGALLGSNTSPGTFVPSDYTLYIGNTSGGSYTLKGTMDELKFYNYERTPAQIIEDMNAGHPIGGSPIGSQLAYYKFDEGYGTTAHDSSQEYDASVTSPVWTSEGKINKTLSFNGSTDLTLPATLGTNTTFGGLEGAMTFSMWLYVEDDSTEVTIMHHLGGAWYYFGLNAASKFQGMVYNCTDSVNYWPTSNSAIPLNTWTHVVSEFTGEGYKFYINGKLDKEISEPKICLNNSGTPHFGQNNIGWANFKGRIDEVKIYSTALTTDQIKLDYNQGKSVVMGASGTESDGSTPSFSADRSYCIPGDTTTCNPPIAEWKFDEKTGTTANDTSGNGNTGTLTNMEAEDWKSSAECKYGACLEFDGSNEYITNSTITLSNTDKATVELWFNPSSVAADDIKILFENSTNFNNSTTGIILSYNEIGQTIIGGHKGNIGYSLWQSSITPIANKWYHITLVVDKSLTTKESKLYINGMLNGDTYSTYDQNNTNNFGDNPTFVGSRGGSSYFADTKIDHVHIYDYARTPAQIAWDYNRGAPIGWWKFDKGEGLTAYDSSGLSNTGTLTNMDNSDWVTGKINTALTFDGNNDDVIINYNSNLDFGGDPAKPFTFSAWVNPNTLSGDTRSIINYSHSIYFEWSSANSKWMIGTYDGTWTSRAYSNNSDTSTGNWKHIVAVNDSSYLKLYIDGVSQEPVSTGSAANNQNDPNIGSQLSGGYRKFSGLIDDVRIYNYALTSTQVKTLYNNGAVSFD